MVSKGKLRYLKGWYGTFITPIMISNDDGTTDMLFKGAKFKNVYPVSVIPPEKQVKFFTIAFEQKFNAFT